MKTEWNEKRVLCAYDVRGIQDYIFRTNRIVDVMGASRIIEDIIMKVLSRAVQEVQVANVLLSWESDEDWKLDEQELRFLKDETVQIQVLYIGGGNAYVLFRTGLLASKINRKMARYVLEESYSLQLAIASIEYTGDYHKDFGDLSKNLATIKGQSPISRVTGALPIMEVERATGFPAIEQSYKYGAKELIGYETKKKREAKKQGSEEGKEKNLDSLITEKGIDSMIAIVHLDGNNMGSRIKLLMGELKDYTKAIQKIRQISRNINYSFKETIEKMKGKIEEKAEQHVAFQNKKEKVFIRPLIVAGDDITFICNASVAMAAVEYFCKQISQKVLYQEPNKEKNFELYGFSVCAGIAYVNSHFPFHAGYDVAEACCDSAKKRAKEVLHKIELKECGTNVERIGNCSIILPKYPS